MVDRSYIQSLRIPTSQDPLRILVSACLIGIRCGADGSSYGAYPHIKALMDDPHVQLTAFCPEHFSFGTPREIPDIQGGNGGDVLDGKATVVTETGKDVTEGMIRAAQQMLQIAQEQKIELAIMMDVSAACGSQVIYKGHRLSPDPIYQIGLGVCAELLKRHGYKIMSQRDFRSFDLLLGKIKPSHISDLTAIDHDETQWYKEYFGK
ncbi:MAG: 2-thiouracil desulfurase family protein [Bacteroidota bacterium]